MSVKLVVLKKKTKLKAEEIPVGHVCINDSSVLALRTNHSLFFLKSLAETLVIDCKNVYEDLGPLEIEFSDSSTD